MGFLDPKPLTPGALDAAVTAKINDGASATKAALNATYAPLGTLMIDGGNASSLYTTTFNLDGGTATS